MYVFVVVAVVVSIKVLRLIWSVFVQRHACCESESSVSLMKVCIKGAESSTTAFACQSLSCAALVSMVKVRKISWGGID